jgi:hypothetical protein
MDTHRVTLTAFGTTGVLLAASLTMLAIVSALVTFDAWPTRERGPTAAEIAVQTPRAARVVRTSRRASATTGSGAAGDVGGGGSDGGGPGGTLPGGNSPGGGPGGGGDGPGGPGGSPPSGDPSPSPHVGPSPPGEGDPGPGVTPQTQDPVGEVVETACGTVSGVSAGAAGAVGACKAQPESYDDPYGAAVPVETTPPMQVDVPALP